MSDDETKRSEEESAKPAIPRKDIWDRLGALSPAIIAVGLAIGGWWISTIQLNTSSAFRNELARSASETQLKMHTNNLVVALLDDLSAPNLDQRFLAREMLDFLARKGHLSADEVERLRSASFNHNESITERSTEQTGEGTPGQTEARPVEGDGAEPPIPADANYVTYTLTITHIEVIYDCDNWLNLGGDFFYSFSVNQQVIAELSEDEYISREDDEKISINRSYKTTVREGEEVSVVLSGFVTDWDEGLAGSHDELKPLETTIDLVSAIESQPEQSFRMAKIGVDDCEVVLHIRVSRTM